MSIAEKSWSELNGQGERIKWINQYLFNLVWEDTSVADVKIGDKNSTKTYLFIFFNEIFLNAVKAISYVNKQSRFFKVALALTDNGVSVNMQNSAIDDKARGNGFGRMIIENYIKMFDIKDFSAGFDTNSNCYEMHFSIPIFSAQTTTGDKK